MAMHTLGSSYTHMQRHAVTLLPSYLIVVGLSRLLISTCSSFMHGVTGSGKACLGGFSQAESRNETRRGYGYGYGYGYGGSMADSAASRDAIVGSTCAAGATGGAAAMNMTPPTRQHAFFTMWLHSILHADPVQHRPLMHMIT